VTAPADPGLRAGGLRSLFKSALATVLRLPSRVATLDVGLCAALKALATAFVLLSGFSAISDDDYARVVIAERLATSPTLDPSGTSWLPFPFYAYGVALRLFGGSLWVARGVACISGVASVLLVLAAARVLGLRRPSSLVAAAAAGLLPYSLYLGAATVPEAFTAGLMVFAAATLTAGEELRLLGALALFLAAGSRYEAWPLCAAFFAFSAYDAWKTRDRTLWPSALIALAFPLLWVLHGVFRHGDALFFVTRVSAYRAALGPDAALSARALRTPLALLTGEPEVVALAVCALPLLLRRTESARPAWLRWLFALSSVPLFLVAGDLRGSAPTHHGERALLALWFGAAIVVAAGVEVLLRTAPRWRLRAALVGCAALALGLVVRGAAPRAPFVDRRLAEAIGERARTRATRVAIDTPDYAFFAIQAAFGHPERTFVFDDRDPRKPRPEDLLARDPRSLAERLSREGIAYLVLPRARAPLTHAIGRVSEGNSSWVIVELTR
jgi:hypothetical protein